MATKSLACVLSENIRFTPTSGGGSTNLQHAGTRQQLIVGPAPGSHTVYRAYLKFALDWSDVRKITKAVLRITTTSAIDVSVFGSSPSVRVMRLTSAFSEGGASWAAGGALVPVSTSSARNADLVGASPAAAKTFSIDITGIVNAWAPKTVLQSTGVPGAGAAVYGIRLSAPAGESLAGYNSADFFEMYSHEAGATYDPDITLTYELSATPPGAPTLIKPSGTTPQELIFQGNYTPGLGPARMAKTDIRVYRTGSLIWSRGFNASGSEQDLGQFSVPIPDVIKSETTYEWEARNTDTSGRVGPYSAKRAFAFSNVAPTLALQPLTSYATLEQVRFRGTLSDAEGDPLRSYQIQLRTQTAPGSVDWDSVNDWDSGIVVPSAAEVANKTFDREYGGGALAAGTYTWRARVQDKPGAWSLWMYDDLVLTQDYDPNPGGTDFLTGYKDRKTPTRVLIYSMAANRGPGAVLATIEDAANVGASKYHNAAGEFYMTLPGDHPQVAVIEPWKVHYAVQVWNGDRYIARFNGLIVDFDATENDVVFYGMDYLGLLDLLIDQRYNMDASDGAGSSGSKHTDLTITQVYSAMLAYARDKPDSPVKFITVPAVGSGLDNFSEKVTIYSTFAHVLTFLLGLMDSHRQGTGKRSRLSVKRSVAAGPWSWRLEDAPGIHRPNIRLEYGGLVQGFRLTAFGDFRTFMHGIGRTKGGKILYASAQAPGIPVTTYGRNEDVSLYDQVSDLNDLTRRLKQAAASAGRVGKRVALGLRVDALMPFAGYDIADTVPIRIQRGVVNTEAYGSGNWSIMGVEWKQFPDGHQENTLVVLPVEDSVPPDADLIPSAPILDGQEWQIGYNPPDPGNPAKLYLDLNTGITYENGEAGWVVLDNPDALAPPTALALSSVYSQTPEGVSNAKLVATLTQPTGDGLLASIVEVTAEVDGGGVPVWGNAAQITIPAGDTVGTLQTVMPDTTYFGRAYSVTNWQQNSLPTGVVSSVMVKDSEAPAKPAGISLSGALRGFAAAWSATLAPDLRFYEIRFAVDDGTGTGPGASPDWQVLRARTNFIFVGGLSEGVVTYWVQVRAIDTTGNVELTNAPPTAVDFLEQPEAGWTDAASVTSTLVDGELIAPGAISDVHIGSLSADVLTTGTLRISTSTEDAIDGIQVFRDGVLVGLWNEDGLSLFDPDDPSDYVHITDAAVTVFENGVEKVAITPEGINASIIGFGTLPGAANIILNSSFELSGFTSAPSTWIETASADWTASRVGADTNLTTGATALTMAGVSY